ncbi:hypothetical protein CXB51_029147 [Gossypium anomalum]|uniref:RNase H type-1 domain-containing protein n=1 Tax=Gossypium anomalum TaxID=47600 RepID=A0A8J6CR14_9ROSI|nr:hypothetical protein CXB51_029147 [Gossypium anomalum]
MEEDFKILIGNGRMTLFWMDIWCGNRPLKHDFPRLFCLARQKESSIADFLRNPRFCRDEWNELFTRSLLGRVEVMLSRLVEKVSSTVLVLDVEDKLCWANDRNGEFSVPPRARSFLWMLAIGKIPTKEFLVKRGEKFLVDINFGSMLDGLVSKKWCRIDSIKIKLAASILRPSPHGWLKFNVCGIAKEDRAVCGGVLRDNEGVARALFSGFAAANDADLAEIGTVNVALEAMRPWSLQEIFAGIESDMLKVGNVVFSMAEKNGNEMASSLAIAGINREKMFKAW